MADHFETAHRLPEALDQRLADAVESTYRYVTKTVEIAPKLLTTDIYEVTKLTSQLKLRKAPGLDGVSSIQIKHLPKKGVARLTAIFNAFLKSQYFPAPWKEAVVVPISKPGKPPHLLSSYRPISLLPTMSKLLEKIINSRLNTHLTKHNILMPEQYGFRERHGTTQQLFRLADHIRHHANINKHTVQICLDLQQAFDKVWHQGLLHKMVQIDFPMPLIQLIANYMTNRSFSVRLGNSASTTRSATAGVPQGSVLGLRLFTIFINDLPKHQRTTTALFADDTAIYSSS